LAAKKTKKPVKNKEKKTRNRQPKPTHIYAELDAIVKRQAEEEQKAMKPFEARVLGLSFTDYAEYKFLGADGVHDPFIQRNMGVNIDRNYHPHMRTEPVNVVMEQDSNVITAIKPFTAAEMKAMTSNFGSQQMHMEVKEGAKTYSTKADTRIIWPKYYQNPYQYQDYVYLQDIYANTIAGRIFDVVVHFSLANGIKPKLKIKNEEKYDTPEQKQKFLKEHKWMTDALEEIDRNVSTSSAPTAWTEIDPNVGRIESIGPYGTAESPDTPTFDHTLQSKWASVMTNALMFGRDCIIPRVDPLDNEVTVDYKDKEETYKNIPKIILVIHPRDMGFNYVDYRTHRLLGLQLNNSNWILKPDEMIFWEWKPDNPVYGSKFYGMSAAQSMMGSARTLRRCIEVDFPLIAKTRWSGMYWLVFKRKGEAIGTSDVELARILSKVELNGINATLEENPADDFMLHKIDLDPKIAELLQMVKDLIQYMMAQVGMPQGLLYGEQDLNRDTLSKKIATWTKSTLKSYRQWFLEQVTLYWYRRMTKTIEKQSKKWEKALKEIEVLADVEEFRLEDMLEQVEYISKIQQIIGQALTTKAIGEMLDIPDIDSMIDPDREQPEAMQTNNYQVSEQGSNRRFGVNTRN
jgi:hypothetical protein